MKLAEGIDRFDLDVFLYCLMSNQIHLLVGTPKGNLGRFMGWWLTACTVYFNRKHNRNGHLTQGRYGAKLVEDDEYLLTLSRYIHLNPIPIASIKKLPIEERFATLRSYRWSSFPGYVLARKAQDFVSYVPMLELISGGRARPRHMYRRYVEQRMGAAEEEWMALQDASPIAIGSEGFIEEIESLYSSLLHGQSKREDASFRRLGQNIDPAEVMSIVAEVFGISEDELRRQRRNVWDRAVASRFLVQYSGLTQREVAAHLFLGTGGAVSAQLRKLETAVEADRKLKLQLKAAEKKIAKIIAKC